MIFRAVVEHYLFAVCLGLKKLRKLSCQNEDILYRVVLYKYIKPYFCGIQLKFIDFYDYI